MEIITQEKFELLEKDLRPYRANIIGMDGIAEGIWIMPKDIQTQTKIQDDNSVNEEIEVYLMNQPLCWGQWGLLVKAKTRHRFCPVIEPAFNKELFASTKHTTFKQTYWLSDRQFNELCVEKDSYCKNYTTDTPHPIVVEWDIR